MYLRNLLHPETRCLITLALFHQKIQLFISANVLIKISTFFSTKIQYCYFAQNICTVIV
nr:MAG TPA: hypothetical protein [Caudoviricetes sp.]